MTLTSLLSCDRCDRARFVPKAGRAHIGSDCLYWGFRLPMFRAPLPMGKGLLGVTLHYAHEVRSEADYFSDIQEITLPTDMLQIAERIVEMKSANFDPALLEDRYRTVLVSMLRAKQAKLPQKAEVVAPKQQNVIDLMEVLKRSLSA